jgi:hypothetical protein
MTTSGSQRVTRLRDLSVFVRSKNAGSFMLTIDVFFEGPEQCRRVLEAGVLTPETVAALYRVSAATVKVMHIEQANALKVSLPRPFAAGEIGDRDVAGGQQFAPLLDLRIP